MSLLVELTVAGATRRISAGGYSDSSYYWDAMIVAAPSLSLSYGDSGGYIKPSFGAIGLSPELFSAIPADTLPAKLYWYDSSTGATTLLYTGALTLEQIERDVVTYSIREHNFDIDLLDVGVDENGSAVPSPIAMGTVSTAAWQPFFPAQRTTDVGGKQTFYKAGGSISTGLKLYDDYADVTSSCTDNFPGSPYRTVSRTTGTQLATMYITPVAQDISTLEDLADHISSLLGVTVSYPASYSTMPLVKYAQTNRRAIDFLDKACGFYGQVFTISGDLSTLTFSDRSVADPSPIAIDSFDFFEAPVSGKRLIRSISTRSENARMPEQDPTDSSWHMAEKEWYAKVTGDEYGDDIDIETFLDYRAKSYFRSQNVARMSSLLTLWRQAWASVTMPIDGHLYDIGRDLVITDDTFSVTMTTTMKILGIDYNFDAETVTYRGPGVTV